LLFSSPECSGSPKKPILPLFMAEVGLLPHSASKSCPKAPESDFAPPETLQDQIEGIQVLYFKIGT